MTCAMSLVEGIKHLANLLALLQAFQAIHLLFVEVPGWIPMIDLERKSTPVRHVKI